MNSILFDLIGKRKREASIRTFMDMKEIGEGPNPLGTYQEDSKRNCPLRLATKRILDVKTHELWIHPYVSNDIGIALSCWVLEDDWVLESI